MRPVERTIALLVVASAMGVAAAPALAAPSDLDPNFGSGGKLPPISPSHYAEGVGMAPGGRIVEGGYIWQGGDPLQPDLLALGRTGSGTVDWVTQTNLYTETSGGDTFGSPDYGAEATVAADGSVLVFGESEFSHADHLVLARYAPAGGLDETFGDHGKVAGVITRSPNEDIFVGAVAVGPGGEVVTAGLPETSLVRYTAAGAPTGSTATPIDEADALAVQPDGKILLAGEESGNPAGLIARYNSNLTLDTSFGGDGVVETTEMFFRFSSTAGIALQPNGDIVVGGTAPALDFALERFRGSDGTVDTSFGTAGVATTDFGGRADSVSQVVIQPDGKIVVAGSTADLGAPGPEYVTAVARYIPDGTPDLTFAPGGKTSVGLAPAGSSVNGQHTIAPGLALQPDGKIVVAGPGYSLARLLGGSGPVQRGLTVTATAGGAVTGEGIDCPGDCAESYDDGHQVTLTASAAAGFAFSGWSGGGCSGTGICQVTMSADRTVTAGFDLQSSAPGGSGGGSGGPPTGGGTTTTTTTTTATPPTEKKPLRCKKGFKRKRVKGRVRCVRVKRGHRQKARPGALFLPAQRFVGSRPISS